MIPELPVAMLACTRIGAVHSVVFGGFSSDALRDRIIDAEARVLVTADGGWRAGRAGRAQGERRRGAWPRRRRSSTWSWRAGPATPAAADRHDRRAATTGGTSSDGADAAAGGVRTTASPSTWTPRTCSSSSTPRAPRPSPRASCTPPGGYLTQVAFTHRAVFDLHPERDVYWCAADIGWVTGHSYIVYGPLANGATSVMYEGTPDFPDKDRWWSIIERYGVTILYSAPTAIRTFMKWGTEYPERHDLSIAAGARLGGRADQSRGLDVVLRPHRRRPLPGRRHLVADRDRAPS